MVSALIGKWNLTESENFDEFLKEMGVGMTWRKLASSSKPTVTITNEGDNWSLKTSTLLKNSEIKFEIGKEFTEHRIDGENVKTVVNVDGDKLVQKQFGATEGASEVHITRWVEGDMLCVKCQINEIISTRKYKKA